MIANPANSASDRAKEVRETLDLHQQIQIDLGDVSSVSPVAPCTQVGWGVVNMSNVMPIYNHLAGIEEIPSRPGDVVACMNANQQIREAYWS